ncbi:MAG: thioredoxin family protein [Propionibacteriaceae bacterium]|nr:thioredoxin family protein [Propionibacteriaceae bacterium]
MVLGYGQELGGTATFLQFSSPACAPCRVTARVLSEVESAADGVAHIEIDAEQRLDLVGRLGITRTPTVLLLDANGVEHGRILGAPRKEEVLAALDRLRTTGAGTGSATPAQREGGRR